MIEIRTIEWTKDEEDISREHGFIIESKEDYLDVRRVIHEALKEKGYDFFGVN